MNGVLLFSRKCALDHFSIFNNTVITIFTNFMQYELVKTVHTDPLLIAKKVRKQITLKELFQGNFFLQRPFSWDEKSSQKSCNNVFL